MNRNEMLLEIEMIKNKLAQGCDSIEQTNLLIALLALYESVVARDTQMLKDTLLVEWVSVMSSSSDVSSRKAA
jgi:hypothetical protein